MLGSMKLSFEECCLLADKFGLYMMRLDNGNDFWVIGTPSYATAIDGHDKKATGIGYSQTMLRYMEEYVPDWPNQIEWVHADVRVEIAAAEMAGR